MRWFIFTFLLCGLALSSVAQYSDDLMFGLKAGINQSSIGHLSPIFVSENYYSGYTFKEEKQIRPAATLFVNYQINSSRISLEGQASYFQQATNLVYSDIKDFTYTAKFQYHYLGVGGYIKTMVVSGFNLGVGLRMGINLSPDNLTYQSNSSKINWAENSSPPSDDETQQELRSVIKGLNTTELGMMATYELDNGFSMELSYYTGLNDAIETLVNRHNFIDPNNRTSSFQLTIGYAISVDR